MIAVAEVVNNNEFKIIIGLTEYGIDRGFDEVRVIVVRDDDGDFRVAVDLPRETRFNEVCLSATAPISTIGGPAETAGTDFAASTFPPTLQSRLTSTAVRLLFRSRNGYRATMQMPQGLDAQHSGEQFRFE